MPASRLLYFTPSLALLYRATGSGLQLEAELPYSEEGLQAFSRRVAEAKRSVFHLLFDRVEESFHIEHIPYVRGSDRASLIERRMAQRFRETTFSTSISLGFERTQRREERLLLACLASAGQFEPWIDILLNAQVAISGVYSPSLLAARLLKRMRRPADHALVVTVHQSGIRQTYLRAGRLWFSRFSPLVDEDRADAPRMAAALVRETSRLHQYLQTLRDFAGQSTALQVSVVVPDSSVGEVRTQIGALAQLPIEVIGLSTTAEAVGLKEMPAGAGGEALFLHLLAHRRPMQQYAAAASRKHYGTRSWQLGLSLGGATIGGACLLVACFNALQAYGLHRSIAADRAHIEQVSIKYAQTTEAFPPLPTTLDSLRGTLDQYRLLTGVTRTPDRTALALSRALEQTPDVRLESLRWTNAAIDPTYANRPEVLEVTEITASLADAQASNYRLVRARVDEFVGALQRQPGFEANNVKLPFSMNPSETFSQQRGLQNEPARFTLSLARKAGS